jgi:hypothetical protein
MDVTWFLTLRKEHRLQKLKNREISLPKQQGGTENCIMKSLISSISCQIPFGNQNKNKGNYVGGTGGRQRGKKNRNITRFWWENMEKGDHLKNQHIYGILI